MIFCLKKFLRMSRGILFFGALIAVVLATAIPVMGQGILKIYGQVLSSDGPVSGVSIYLDKTSYITSTDLYGYYYFYNIPNGTYSLYCYQDKYRHELAEKLTVNGSLALRRDIYLEEGTINVAPVIVEAERNKDNSFGAGFTLELNGTEANLAEIVGHIPGLNVITSGNGNEIYVAPAGARPEALEVYIDGRRINSILTGKADLSQLPMAALKRIEYYPASNAASDGGGLAGRLNFVSGYRSKSQSLTIGAYKGSFGRFDYNVQYSHPLAGYGNIEVGWEKNKRDNNYGYTDYFGNRQIRQNAAQKSDKIYFGYANSVNGVLIKLSGFGYDGSNGIPGKTIAPSLNAQSDKRTISTGGELGYFFKGLGAINLTCSYQNRRTDYRDLVGSTPYLTQYFEEEKALGLSIKGNEWKHLNAELRGSLREQRLEGKDNLRPDYALGIVTRDIYQLGYGLRYRNGVSPLNIEMAISGNTDITDGENYWAQSAQTSIWFDYAIKPGISISYGRSYRLPGLAELNWKEDVFVIANPDLRPEQSNQKSFGIFCEYQALGNWRVSAEYRDIRYKDLIYWRRSQGLRYKPINISKSDYFGTIYSVTYNSPDNIAIVEFSRVKSISLNKEVGQPYDGKQVIFQPSYVNTIQVSLNYSKISGRLEIQDVSQRYYLEENTKALTPYTLINCGLYYRLPIYRMKTELQVSVENIGDIEYELLEYQPMPPRTFGAGLTIKY